MFYGCSKLTAFEISNTSNLSDATGMFSGCTSLETFNGDCSKIIRYACNMFQGCKLNKESVQRIADTLPTYQPPTKKSEDVNKPGNITIHVNKSLPQEDLDYIKSLFNTIKEKGWTVSTNI
jgi:hypothetical protein